MELFPPGRPVATALARHTRNTWARTAKKVVTCVEGDRRILAR